MSYYNYHASVMLKIKSGKLKSYHFDKNYKNIGFALVLCFEDKNYPIREKHFEQYFELIGTYYQIKQVGDICFTIPKNL